MKEPVIRVAALACGAAVFPLLAQAHPGHPGELAFSSGLLHPLLGGDHLLAMLAIGLWAAQLGGRMRWAVPSSFIALMLTGAVLGTSVASFGAVEQAIAASVLACGLLVAFAVQLPTAVGLALAGGFALLHGFAHGGEAPAGSPVAGYFAGFTLCTVALLAVGYVTGERLARSSWQHAVRWTGAAIAVCGAAMLAG